MRDKDDECHRPHEKLLGMTWVSNPATRKVLTARTWGVFWYYSKIPVLFEIMVYIKQKRGTGVKTLSLRSFWCGRACGEVGGWGRVPFSRI